MSKGKFSLTDFRSFNSRELLTKSCKVEDSNRSQYSPYRSAFSRKDITHRSKIDDIQNLLRSSHGSGLRDVPTVEEFSIHSKEALGSARLPSFNIKKLFTGEVKKKSEEKLHVSSHIFVPDPQRSGTSHVGMKRYWQKYLNEEISYGDLTKQLNRNIIDGTRRERRNQSQVRTCKENRDDSKQKVERSAFYVNNFIKTRYRKKRAQEGGQECNDSAKKQEVVVVIPSKQPKQPKQPKQQPKHLKQQDPSPSQRLTPLRNKKSWQMIPWQKFNDPQDEEFSPLQLNL